MSKGRKTFAFVAEGTAPDGSIVRHMVYRKGNSYYVSGPNSREHLCHPSVRNDDDVKNEILLVFQTKISSTKLPWEFITPKADSNERE